MCSTNLARSEGIEDGYKTVSDIMKKTYTIFIFDFLSLRNQEQQYIASGTHLIIKNGLKLKLQIWNTFIRAQ